MDSTAALIFRLTSIQVQSNVLSMLTRLRQLVLHPGLVPANYLEKLKLMLENEDVATPDAPAMQLTAADKVRLKGLLAQAIEDNEECPICFGILAEPRITSCSHCYCLAWYARGLLCTVKCVNPFLMQHHGGHRPRPQVSYGMSVCYYFWPIFNLLGTKGSSRHHHGRLD